MNSLEFIEKEIAMVKKKISMAKSKFTIKNITYEQYKEIKEEIETLKGHLIHLRQIKIILEAWESIKQGLKIREGKIDDDSYYEYLDFEYDLFDEAENEEAGERLMPIKKALEAYDG